MEAGANPILLALAAAIVAGLVASFALGLWRSGRSEAAAGLHALCALKWRDYAHLVEDLLRERGFSRVSGEERRPGDGGFDLLMVRGNARYLVECKNGAAHRVTEQSVRDLAGLVELQGAEGAVLATTGRVEPAAMQLAGGRRVELLAGADLWRQIKPWAPPELRTEAEARARAGFAKRAALAAVIAVAAGLLVAALPLQRHAPVAAPASTPRPTVSLPAPAARPETTATGLALPSALPDASLTEAELEARRAAAALEVRGNPAIENAQWSTKSTLVVALRQAGAPITDAHYEEICRILVQYEEMRYTRVQVESASLQADTAPTVRWRQCR